MEPSGFCPACKQPLPADTPLGGVCPQCLIKSGFYSGTAPEPERREKFAAPAIADLAPHFPQLEILELIGRGGMGAVYKARQPRLNRLVALKVLARERDADARFADRFLREAQALAQMNHPNIVTVHDFGEAGGHYYLVMEYVDGLNLRELERTKKLTPEEALAIVPPICDALHYAHQQGIVHRDIKPENILIDKQGRVKIADFGIAKLLGVSASDEPLTGEQQRVGTPLYMAPEQVEKPTTVDHRADIYSLGVVFYEMLTGELPIGRFAAPSQKVQIDVRLDEIVLRALEKEPGRRYQQVSEIKTEMETLSTPAVQQPVESEAASERGSLIIGAVVMILMIAFGRNIVSKPEALTFWYIGFFTGLAAIVYRLFTLKSKTQHNQSGGTAEDRYSVRSQVLAPAIGLIVAAVVSLLPLLISVPILISQVFAAQNPELSYATRGVIVGIPVFLVAGIGVYIIFGASNMLRVKHRSTAIAASILAMITPPGLILGLPFGIWALVVLNREDVKAAFGAENARSANPDTPSLDVPSSIPTEFGPTEPILSGKALFGFLWAMPAIIYMLTSADAFSVLGNLERNPATLVEAVSRGVFSFFAMAILGTPVIGMLAINDIRRSNGKLKGAALAALDVVIIPGVIFWKVLWANLPHNTPGQLTAGLAFFGIIIALMVLVALGLHSYAHHPLSPGQLKKQHAVGYRRAVSNSILVAIVICALINAIWPELKSTRWKPDLTELIVIVTLWIICIAALHHIGSQRARANHRTSFASIAAAVLLMFGFIVWTDNLEHSVLRVDQSAGGPNPSLKDNGSPTTLVTFPNGTKVTLNAIAMHPDNTTRWRVDGTRLIASEDDPIEEIHAEVHPEDNQIAREFHFEFDNASTEPLRIEYQVEDGQHIAGATDVATSQTYLRLASTLPADKKIGRIKVGLPAVDWQPFHELSMGGGSSYQMSGSEQSSIIITSGKPYFEDDQLHIMVSHVIEGYQFRILAIDLNGNQYMPEKEGSPTAAGGLSQILYVFPDVTSTTKLAKLECQLRFYNWMSFDNIPLWPDALAQPEDDTNLSTSPRTVSKMLLSGRAQSSSSKHQLRSAILNTNVRDYLTAALPTTTVVDFAKGNYLSLDTNSFTTTSELGSADQLTSLGVHLYRNPYQGNLNALTGHNVKLAPLEDKIWDSISLQHITQLPVSFKKMWQDYSTPGAIESGVYLFDTGKNLGAIRVTRSTNQQGVIVEIKTAKP